MNAAAREGVLILLMWVGIVLLGAVGFWWLTSMPFFAAVFTSLACWVCVGTIAGLASRGN